MSNIKPGTYRLNETVKNPKGKERNGSPNWRRHISWPKGTLFIVYDDGEQLCLYRVGNPERTLPIDVPAALLLIAHLEPKVDKPSDWLCSHVKTNAGLLALEVLDRLVAQGKITVDEIKALTLAYEQEDA